MIEIIATSLSDAKIIEKCRADRIELISAFSEGGLTPSYGLIEQVVKSVKIPVNVMIRPHANSFIYTDDDLLVMKRDIEIVKKIGANGVVLGCLNNLDKIDESSLKELLKYTSNLDVTFHRAIDRTENIIESLELLTKFPEISSILTSGGKDSILGNLDIINEMTNLSKNINILLGGGLSFDNINEIITKVKTKHFHFGTAVRVNNSHFENIDEVKLSKLINILKK